MAGTGLRTGNSYTLKMPHDAMYELNASVYFDASTVWSGYEPLSASVYQHAPDVSSWAVGNPLHWLQEGSFTRGLSSFSIYGTADLHEYDGSHGVTASLEGGSGEGGGNNGGGGDSGGGASSAQRLAPTSRRPHARPRPGASLHIPPTMIPPREVHSAVME